VQSVPITTNIVRSNPIHGEVYSIQHNVIKFVSDLRQVGGFLGALRFPPPIENWNIIESGIKNHKPIIPTLKDYSIQMWTQIYVLPASCKLSDVFSQNKFIKSTMKIIKVNVGRLVIDKQNQIKLYMVRGSLKWCHGTFHSCGMCFWKSMSSCLLIPHTMGMCLKILPCKNSK
jgi:hypothetical protein